MMNKVIFGMIGGTVLLLIGIVALGSRPDKMTQLKESMTGDDATVISASGVHWHPELNIFINGEKQEIPGDIGIGGQYASSKWFDSMMGMTDIQTHDASGTLHWEVMKGPVLKGEARLGAFFEIWGKPFSNDQIFDVKTSDGGELTMTVNGEPNSEFENYLVKDGDKIEIRYQY